MRVTASARSRSLAAAGAAVLALVVLLLAVLVVLPWLEVRGLEQQDAVLPAPAVPAAPATETPMAEPEPGPDPARGVPVRVEIAAIDVDAAVLTVEMDGGGRLDPPADVTRVGWWAGGARPGSVRGSVVLAGHSVRLGDGVFDDLGALRPGDEIRVRTHRGVVTYAVDGVRDYTVAQVAELGPALFGRDVQSRLVLVTCSGYYAGHYHANTVVLASPTRGT